MVLEFAFLFGVGVGSSSGEGSLRAGAEAGGRDRHFDEDIDRYAGRRARDVYRRFIGLWIAGMRKERSGEEVCFAMALWKCLTPIIWASMTEPSDLGLHHG